MGRIPMWVDLRGVPVNKRLPFLHAIDETGTQETLLAKDDAHHGRAGLRTLVVDGNGVVKRHKDAVGKWIRVKDAKGVEKAAASEGIAIVEALDWRVIPLENLIAARQDRPGTLFAVARSPEQARLFAQTLETGVHGIVLVPQDAAAIYATDQALRAVHAAPAPPLTVLQAAAVPPAAGANGHAASVASLVPLHAGAPAAASASPTPQAVLAATAARVVAAPLVATPTKAAPQLIGAQVTALEDAGMADRVCIDTTSLFRDGEGLLVGSTATSFALVHAETLSSDFIATRPFRVNAGAVHSYLYGPDDTTRYLSELASGHVVQALHVDGSQRLLGIGRCKVERRPHLLVRWRSDQGTPGHATLQNAETVRLVAPEGRTIAVTQLRPGDRILVHDESAARHAGQPVRESIEER